MNLNPQPFFNPGLPPGALPILHPRFKVYDLNQLLGRAEDLSEAGRHSEASALREAITAVFRNPNPHTIEP